MIIGRRAYRRHLPHFQSDNRTYFVTFVTHGRWILPAVARDLVMRHIQFDHGRKINVNIALVMPDHVHIIASPVWREALPEILHGIKGASARSFNRALCRTGPVWQQESFDHEIRRDESLNEKIEYVANNPVRRGLVQSPSEYPWLMDTGKAGRAQPAPDGLRARPT